jgi:predicted transcriptional regulator
LGDQVTIAGNSIGNSGGIAQPSTLPFDPRDLVEMRVRPAQFARMIGVTKQAVSKWIKDGKITLGPDGHINPKRALDEYFNSTDPNRVRARTLKQSAVELDDLRRRLRLAELELERLQREAEAMRYGGDIDLDEIQRLAALSDALTSRFAEAIEAHAAGRLAKWFSDLVFVHFHGNSPADLLELELAEGSSS